MQHYVPLVMFGISSISTLFGFTVANAVDYGDHWHLIAIFYAIQAFLFNGSLYDALPGAIRYVRPQWDYVGEDMPLFPNVFYWFGFVSRNPVDEEDDEGTNAPVDKDEETGGNAGGRDDDREDNDDDEVVIWTL